MQKNNALIIILLIAMAAIIGYLVGTRPSTQSPASSTPTITLVDQTGFAVPTAVPSVAVPTEGDTNVAVVPTPAALPTPVPALALTIPSANASVPAHFASKNIPSLGEVYAFGSTHRNDYNTGVNTTDLYAYLVDGRVIHFYHHTGSELNEIGNLAYGENLPDLPGHYLLLVGREDTVYALSLDDLSAPLSQYVTMGDPDAACNLYNCGAQMTGGIDSIHLIGDRLRFSTGGCTSSGPAPTCGEYELDLKTQRQFADATHVNLDSNLQTYDNSKQVSQQFEIIRTQYGYSGDYHTTWRSLPNFPHGDLGDDVFEYVLLDDTVYYTKHNRDNPAVNGAIYYQNLATNTGEQVLVPDLGDTSILVFLKNIGSNRLRTTICDDSGCNRVLVLDLAGQTSSLTAIDAYTGTPADVDTAVDISGLKLLYLE